MVNNEHETLDRYKIYKVPNINPLYPIILTFYQWYEMLESETKWKYWRNLCYFWNLIQDPDTEANDGYKIYRVPKI